MVKTIRAALTTAVFLWAALYLAKPVRLVTADLGRHIKNGEVFFETLKPIASNFYSYTWPDYPFVNHHWGSGVLFFLVHEGWGFNGLSLLYISCCLAALFFFFRVAWRTSGFTPAWTALACVVPLAAWRAEVRPEGFSFFLLGLEIWLFQRALAGKMRAPVLAVLVFLVQALWVNLHIYFFLGVALTAGFWIQTRFFETPRRNGFWPVPAAVVGASFLNPFGWKGAFAPFFIFQGYDYMLAENQSVIFWLKRLWPDAARSGLYAYAGIVFLFFCLTGAFHLRKNRGISKSERFPFLGVLFAGLLAMKAARAIPLFGLAALPALAHFFKERRARRIGAGVAGCLIFFSLFFRDHALSPLASPAGIGLEKGVQRSADFFRVNQIQGPVFNNYDIGGYLIYHLYPDWKVFVDNRPEAYPASFFKETYIPMQEKEESWKAMDARYGFNAIFFYRHDMTPWAQPFLIRRLADPEWAPVFVDIFTLILVKRAPQNEELISRFELPKEIFHVS